MCNRACLIYSYYVTLEQKMRIIDKVKEVVQQYGEHFDEIEAEFNKQNDYFKSLVNADHDILGLVLKFHLIVEHYLTNYLQNKFSDLDFTNARLSFSQKINLVSQRDTRAAFIKPGIIELNRIRNKFGHNLGAELTLNDQKEMLEVLKVARQGKTYEEPLEVINDFSTVASTFLIVNPEEIDVLWQEIFESLQNHKG